MTLDPNRIGAREKLILAGLFLSKFDTEALQSLGFETFTEAFNVIGYALGSRPTSIKNYRDEFDPLFPNPRAGWHKRTTRPYCLKVFEEYRSLERETFCALIQSLVGIDVRMSDELASANDAGDSAFARRLLTGAAAERYFEELQPKLPEFADYSAENTTRLGCGYDFRLKSKVGTSNLAVEVKGLLDKAGCLSLTSKEYDVASRMADSFYLFVVKNFRESPFHEIYRSPLANSLAFERQERQLVQVTWQARV